MGYEMYRLLNNATEPKAKTSKKKKNVISTVDSDEDSSEDSDHGWQKKMTKTKADLAMIEKYRKSNSFSNQTREIILQENIFVHLVPI